VHHDPPERVPFWRPPWPISRSNRDTPRCTITLSALPFAAQHARERVAARRAAHKFTNNASSSSSCYWRISVLHICLYSFCVCVCEIKMGNNNLMRERGVKVGGAVCYSAFATATGRIRRRIISMNERLDIHQCNW